MAAILQIDSFPVQVPVSFRPKKVTRPGRRGPCPPGEASGYKPHLFDSFHDPRGELRHSAMDITAAQGTPVVSAVAGRVQEDWGGRPGAGWSERGGWYVRIIDDRGFAHYYAHLMSKPLVRAGKRVRAGQTIGFVGRTGNAVTTCPHLHYSVTSPTGRKVNPFESLKPIYDGGGWRYRGFTPAELLAFAVTAALIVIAVRIDKVARQGLQRFER